jgi:hypothetical protein
VNVGAGGTTGFLPNRGDSNQFNGTNGLLVLPNVNLDAGTILRFQHSGGNNRHLVQINGAGSVEFTGSTTETLFGHNTYTGTTTITGGNVRIGLGGTITPSGALGNTAVSIAAGRNLEFHNDSEVTSFPGSTSGAGTVSFNGQNTITLTGSNSPASISVNAGAPGVVALQNAIGNAMSAPITLTSGRIKLLLSDEIADTSNLTLAGGTLDMNDQDDVLNVLSLTANSFIEMGPTSGSILSFADSSAATWTASTTLSITGWNGTPFSGLGLDQVKFDSSNTALSGTQLSQVQFVNPAGLPAGTYPAQFAASNPGEVVPAPEPGTITLLGGLASLALVRRRRRN